MIRNKKPIIILILVVSLGLICSIVAYAALSTTMNITFSNVTQSAQSWSITLQTGTSTGVASGNSGVECGSATITSNQISGVTPRFSSKGQMCAYTFVIQNNGTIPGKISSITITEPSGVTCTKSNSTMTCGNIVYKIHYNTSDSTTLMTINDTINANSTKTAVLTVEYNTSTPTTFTSQDFTYTITYTQN